MKFTIDNMEYYISWSYKKRKHGRVKTTCRIAPQPLINSADVPLDQLIILQESVQNNTDEGDVFVKKTGRKLSFLKAVDRLIFGMKNPSSFEDKAIKSSIFKQLKETGQIKIIL